jgi:hypothetical protein
MKTFKEYRTEVSIKKNPKKSMETFMGEHSIPKKEKKKSMETSMGEHSKKIVPIEEAKVEHPPIEETYSDKEKTDHAHQKAAPMKKLDVVEKDAVSLYTDSSTGLNGALHHFHNGHNFNESYMRHAKTLTDVLDKNKTKEDTIVYTGVKKSPAALFDNDGTKHASVHLPAFTSTSTSFGTARGFSEPAKHKHDINHGVSTDGTEHRHVLQLHVPKGTSAASVKSHSFLPREHEILLNRGHDISIDPSPTHHIDSNGGHTYVWHARVVGNSKANLDAPDL